jgi:hypothetical protein
VLCIVVEGISSSSVDIGKTAMIPCLTQSDLQTPRNAAQLVQWVKEIHEEFGKTREGRNAMRLDNTDFTKMFREEIWPLARYAENFFMNSPELYFVPVWGSQSFDAYLKCENCPDPISYFEITQALHDEGFQERLRMEHLVEHGHAPLTGPPLRRNPQTRRVQARAEASDFNVDHVEKVINQVRKAIATKVEKGKRFPYRAKTTLIVEFDNSMAQFMDDSQGRLENAATMDFCNLARPFWELAILSGTGKPCLRYQLR